MVRPQTPKRAPRSPAFRRIEPSACELKTLRLMSEGCGPRILGKMTQAVDIMFTTGPRNRGVGALWGVRAAGAKGCAAARAL